MKFFILIILITLIIFSMKDITEKFNNNKYEFVIGAAFKNEGHILDEWIRHYKYHGIDHIYLINDKDVRHALLNCNKTR